MTQHSSTASVEQAENEMSAGSGESQTNQTVDPKPSFMNLTAQANPFRRITSL